MNDKEKNINTGMRFPESLIGQINKIKEIGKKRTFTEVVVDLCWKGVEEYYWEKEVIAKAKKERESTIIEKETSPDAKAK